jgi:hypothetical protein
MSPRRSVVPPWHRSPIRPLAIPTLCLAMPAKATTQMTGTTLVHREDQTQRHFGYYLYLSDRSVAARFGLGPW